MSDFHDETHSNPLRISFAPFANISDSLPTPTAAAVTDTVAAPFDFNTLGNHSLTSHHLTEDKYETSFLIPAAGGSDVVASPSHQSGVEEDPFAFLRGGGEPGTTPTAAAHRPRSPQRSSTNSGGHSYSVEDESNRLMSNVFVCMLPSWVTDTDLAKLFAPFGPIESAKVMLNIHTGKSRGIAFVKYYNTEDAQRAIAAMDGHMLGDRRLGARISNAKASYKPGQPTNKLFVRNVPVEVSQERLVEHFTQFGDVSEVSILNDTVHSHVPADISSPDHHRKIAFVTYTTTESAAVAAEQTHTKFPFPECGTIPLLAKVAANSGQRRGSAQSTSRGGSSLFAQPNEAAVMALPSSHSSHPQQHPHQHGNTGGASVFPSLQLVHQSPFPSPCNASQPSQFFFSGGAHSSPMQQQQQQQWVAALPPTPSTWEKQQQQQGANLAFPSPNMALQQVLIPSNNLLNTGGAQPMQMGGIPNGFLPSPPSIQAQPYTSFPIPQQANTVGGSYLVMPSPTGALGQHQQQPALFRSASASFAPPQQQQQQQQMFMMPAAHQSQQGAIMMSGGGGIMAPQQQQGQSTVYYPPRMIAQPQQQQSFRPVLPQQQSTPPQSNGAPSLFLMPQQDAYMRQPGGGAYY